jgi:hypothetical protein
MTLPASGILYLSQIQAEFGGPNYLMSSYYRGGGYVTANNTGVPASGAIYFSQFYGTQKSVAGSWNRTAPGTYTLVIPVFSTFVIDTRGAGGGGGGSTYDAGAAGATGAAGTDSVVKDAANIIYGNGGGGGVGSYYNVAANGANGTGVGGDTNTTGGGSAGGTGGSYGATKGGNGGAGGRAVRTFSVGELAAIVAGNTITIVVGTGGNGGAGQVAGAKGTNGAVYISWT